MMSFIKKIIGVFKPKSTPSLLLAENMLTSFIGVLDESTHAGHPCPDYVLRNIFQDISLNHATIIINENRSVPQEVLDVAHMIIDYNRLEKENKPIPLNFVRDRAQNALNVVQKLL